MKRSDDINLDVERKSSYRGIWYFSEYKRNLKEFEDEHFVVPWQMEKKKVNEIQVK